jgi:hypothetical protein
MRRYPAIQPGSYPKEISMRRNLTSVLVLAIVAALAPMSAQADHCNRNVVLFPAPYGVNTNVAWCIADGGEDVDARILPPGSTGVQVRYIGDFGAEVPRLDAWLSGSLFPTPVKVRLNRAQATGGGFVYDSSTVNFPGGRTSSGCANVYVEVPDDDLEDNENETAYHHIDASC